MELAQLLVRGSDVWVNTPLPPLEAQTRGSARWTSVMKGAISKNAAYFNSHRMMRRYATEAYLR
jgi:starch phosphorylase